MTQRRDFHHSLKFGQQGEDVVIGWICGHGYYVIPTSDIRPRGVAKAPSMVNVMSGRKVVLPDLQAAMEGYTKSVEVKTKSKDVIYGKACEHRQGMERRLFEDYLFVQNETGIPGTVAFLVITPAPTLRMATLDLMHEHQIHMTGSRKAYGDKEMVYWPIDLFESWQIESDALLRIMPQPQHAHVHHVWERAAPRNVQRQEYFPFGQR